MLSFKTPVIFLLVLSKSKYMYSFLLKCYVGTGLSPSFEKPGVRV